jgi:GrpB-like predicted nucleotidyltransferase (UPF0157 family)
LSADDAITLVEFQKSWALSAVEEIERLKKIIPHDIAERFEHIGSTAVPGCKAKPILDLAVQVKKIENGVKAIEPLASVGYVYWDSNPDKAHMFFVKGLPPYGTGRTHHLHFFERARFAEHLRFRDILRENSAILKNYQDLKTELAAKFRQDREAYTKAKSDFITRTLRADLCVPFKPINI